MQSYYIRKKIAEMKKKENPSINKNLQKSNLLYIIGGNVTQLSNIGKL